MFKRLLLTLAVLLPACAADPAPRSLAFDGPTPGVRPPPARVGVPNSPGQPGQQGQPGVKRNKDPRILPPSSAPGIYAASSERPRWAVRILPPKSADKTTWQLCEGLVLANLSDPQGLHASTLESARKMTDMQWKCAFERSMQSCYLFQKAPTKNAQGFLAARAQNEDFINDMARRQQNVCADVPVESDAQEVIDAYLARARMYSWKPATGANINQDMLPTPPADALAQLAREQARRNRPKTITTNRETQRPPAVKNLPQPALDACWDATQQCMNLMETVTWSDPLYKCVRWHGAQRCAFKGSRYGHPGKTDADYQAKWGGVWTSDTLLGVFDPYKMPHCLDAARQGVTPEKLGEYLDALYRQCDGRYDALFR